MNTAAVADACLRLRLPIRIASPRLKSLVPGWQVAGPALPVRHYGSVDVFFDAMLNAAPGDVLVIDNDGRTDEGCIGDLTVLEAMQYRIGGIVLWGCHRDARELRELALPVFSIGACPAGPQRLDRRDPDAQPAIDGLPVRRGDLVVADDDGVLIVDGDRASEVLDVAASIVATERAQADRVRRGESLHAQFKWDDYVRRRAVDATWTLRDHLQTLGAAIEV
jgi:4-hydroxy-4-methyl-2-oxoglutarate aldolase